MIPGTNGKKPVSLWNSNVAIDKSTKQCAFEEIQMLVKNGYLNKELDGRRGFLNWFVTPENKQLVVLSWELEEIKSEQQATNFLNNVHHALFEVLQ